MQSQCRLQSGENGAVPSLAEALKGRTSIKSIVEAEDEGLSNVGSSLLVAGWVRTGRQQGSGVHEPWAFLELNDGSTHANLQVTQLLACWISLCHLSLTPDRANCRLRPAQPSQSAPAWLYASVTCNYGWSCQALASCSLQSKCVGTVRSGSKHTAQAP